MIEIFNEVLEEINKLPKEEQLLELGRIRSLILRTEQQIKEENKEKANYTNKDKWINDEILRVLYRDKNNQEMAFNPEESVNYISVFDLNKYLLVYKKKIERTLNNYNNRIEEAFHGRNEYLKKIWLRKVFFTEGEERIIITNCKFSSITATKKDSTLKLDGFYNLEELNMFFPIFRELFGKLQVFKDYLIQMRNYSTDIANSALNITLIYHSYSQGYDIKVSHKDCKEDLMTVSDDGKVSISSQLCTVHKTLEEHGIDLLKNSYIRITDLPIFIQEELIELRKLKFEIKKLNNRLSLNDSTPKQKMLTKGIM